MAEAKGFEPSNLFLDQTVFETVLFTNTVELPLKWRKDGRIELLAIFQAPRVFKTRSISQIE